MTLAELVSPTLQPAETHESRLTTQPYTDNVLRREDVIRAKRTYLYPVSRWLGSASWQVPFCKQQRREVSREEVLSMRSSCVGLSTLWIRLSLLAGLTDAPAW